MERSTPETAQKSIPSFSLGVIQPGSSSSSAADETDSGVHVCEVCGGYFETKRGLSSHCRSHLRQLGVSVSESSGAPIHLLYKLIHQRDGKLPFNSSLHRVPPNKPPKKHKTPKSPQTPTMKVPQPVSTNPTQSLIITAPISLTPKPPQSPNLNPPQSPISKHPQSLTIKTPKHHKSLTTKTHKHPQSLTTKTNKHPQSLTTKTLKKPKPSLKKNSATKLKIKISTLVKKYSKSPVTAPTLTPQTPGSSSLPKSSLKPKKSHKVPGEQKKVPVPVSPSLSSALTSSKPLWAPQETDAPLNLTAMTDSSQRDDVHVCELCGAWYETRKGLSSHARAHLRQFGVNIDSKGAPIDILHELLQKEEHINNFGDFTPSSTSPKHTSKLSPPSSPAPKERTSTHVTPPPAKKLKISPATAGMEALSEQPKGNSPKDVFCDFCHEKFKKSQSLASHARCHLRQLGVTEWTVQGSPMATLRELMARRGATSLPKPNASPTKHGDPSTVAHSSPFAPPNQADATPKKHHTSCTEPNVPPLQPETLLAKPLALPSKPGTTPSKSSALPSKPVPIHTKPSLSTALSPTPTTLPSVAPITPSSNPAPLRVPKARKGSRMVVPRPKDEPVEREVSIIEALKPKSTSTPLLKSPASNTEQTNTVPKAELDVSMSVRCDYCSEMFDSRKALSCHARAHLRQLGVKWSPNASPIDTLYKLLLREGKVTSPQSFTSSPVDVLREKTDPLDSMASGLEATCELCGFDFENRKALASHARAHLRQQGVDWHTNGSPIETLSEWMQREPAKVAELHRRYLQGELPQVVKRKTSSSSPHPSHSELELTRPPPVREFKSHPSTSSAHRKPSASQHASTHASARGCERRPPKHLSHSQSRLGVEPVKRVGIVPSLMPRPPESSLVKLVGKIYSLKCRFCEEVFKGPLSVQEDWLIHLRQHILNLKRDSAHNSTPALQSPTPTVPHTDTVQLIDPDVK